MLRLITAPTVEPVTVAQAKAQCRVDFSDDDTYFAGLIRAARRRCETELDRSFTQTTWQQSMDGFPGQYSRYSADPGNPNVSTYGYSAASLFGYIPERFLVASTQPINVDKSPLLSLISITYLDASMARQTMDPSTYTVQTGDGGRVVPTYGTRWPSATVYPGSVQINFTAGYGTDATTVPDTLIMAILMLVSHFYVNRTAVTAVAKSEMPLGVKWLLASEDWGCRI